MYRDLNFDLDHGNAYCHDTQCDANKLTKTFSREKLFIRFAFYKNAKEAHCTKSIDASTLAVKVYRPAFLVKVNFMSYEKF